MRGTKNISKISRDRITASLVHHGVFFGPDVLSGNWRFQIFNPWTFVAGIGLMQRLSKYPGTTVPAKPWVTEH